MILDRFIEPAVQRRLRAERVLVEQPRRARAVFIRGVVAFAVVFGSFVVMQWTDPGPLHALCSVIVGGWLGWNATALFARALAYRSGWSDGREVMIASMSEAMRRGLTMNDWLIGEMERDAAVYGFNPYAEPPEEERGGDGS